MSMQRRSSETNGWVNFPVNDPAYKNSSEGGLFVRLVVHQQNDWMVCCGGSNYVIFDETLIGFLQPPVGKKYFQSTIEQKDDYLSKIYTKNSLKIALGKFQEQL